MTTCAKCGQSSSDRLCKTCELDQDREFYERRAEEMDDQRNSHANATLQMLREAEEKGIDGASERIAELSGGDSA